MAVTELKPYTNVDPGGSTRKPDRAEYLTGLKELQLGQDSKVMRADRRGLWLGGEEPGDAPFRVDMDGNVVATSISLSGYVAVGEAADDVNNNTTTINGGKITAGTIEADRMDVNQLSAISANIGSITSGLITGATIRTASGDTRVEMDGSANVLNHYQNGNIRTTVADGQISFNRPDGVFSGAVFGLGSNSLGINVGGGGSYTFNQSQFLPAGSGVIDLGAAFAEWQDLFLSGGIDAGGSIDVGGNIEAGGHIDADEIQGPGGNMFDLTENEGPIAEAPLGLDVMSGTPGSASSYEGYVYFDTTASGGNIVFSDGNDWFEVQASAL